MKDMSKLQSEIYSEIFKFYGPCYYILICYITKAFFKEKNKIRLLKYITMDEPREYYTKSDSKRQVLYDITYSISNKNLLYNTGNNIQYLIIDYNGK